MGFLPTAMQTTKKKSALAKSARSSKPREKSHTAKAVVNGGDGQAANLGFEATLFKAADKLRNNMDAAEYKHVVLGLIFLKYISDAFQEKHEQLVAEQTQGADPEDRDEYKADNIFWVPKEARWSFIQAKAKMPEIGKLIDDAMDAIEHDNPSLQGVLPKNYARPALDKQRLGELIDLIATIGLGSKEHKSKDILGRVYEYFLAQFASAELSEADIQKIASTYHAWRGDKTQNPNLSGTTKEGQVGGYVDVPGFCKSATLEEIRSQGYVLTPGRYVGAAPQEEDDEPFDEKMQRLVAELREQQAEAAKLDAAIARNLQELGYG